MIDNVATSIKKPLVPKTLPKNKLIIINKEYIEILSRECNPSTNFWELKKRIDEDKRHIGVVIDMRRSRMVSNLLMMLEEKVIVIEELDDFSEELKEEINLYFRG